MRNFFISVKLQLISSWARFSSGVKVSWSSSTAFATVGTAVVTLVIIPVLSVLFDVLLGSDIASPDLLRTGYAAALIAIIASVSSGVVSAVVGDRNLGIFQHIHTLRKVDIAYWCTKAAIPALLAIITATAVIFTVVLGAIISKTPVDLHTLIRVTSLVPYAVILGVLLGIGVSGIGVDLPDPYLASTISISLLPLAAGVIVPVSSYPLWLKTLTWILPGSGIADSIMSNASFPTYDLAISSLWALIGIIISIRALSRMREGLQRESL